MKCLLKNNINGSYSLKLNDIDYRIVCILAVT